MEFTAQHLLLFLGSVGCSGLSQGLPKARVTVKSPQDPFYPGDTVTLRCDITEYTDWEQYRWYRNTIKIPNKTSKIITISLHFGSGQYNCYGWRRAQPQFSYISASILVHSQAPPRATLTVAPQSPVWTGDTVTLRCEVASLTGWRYKWYKGRSQTAVSQSDRYNRTGDTLTIRGAAESDQDQYWCQGERDTRPTSSLISAHLTLAVKEPSDLTADFYKDGVLLQTRSTGQMTIPVVSKSHEGFYQCKHREMGESLETWFSVISADAFFSGPKLFSTVAVVVVYALLTVVAGVKCYSANMCT
ncbi:low affinity immunoglobulin gamma Fc region receptor II-like isoform X2 [Denticeps clupeoides]|uniref:low affinity immunoglobulin gamma Fc region receptor II-like isoform X2 n=1 Tax=Denticeps clupeoides TaxID=299321 RepID=UPI0010A4DC11|nr:low affinity immunoglobulin gamma Fc region receptor II-like isoform X2 [Denticeps clupeoides]